MNYRKIAAAVLVETLTVGMIGCGNATTSTSTAEIVESYGSVVENIENVAGYNDYILEVKDVVYLENYDGSPAVLVSFTFTNSGEDALYAMESYAIHAYQNGVELDNITDINNGSEEMLNTIISVKDGASIDVQMAFANDDTSDVTLEICEPTDEENVIWEKVFTISA